MRENRSADFNDTLFPTQEEKHVALCLATLMEENIVFT
jgi:hypothetical protein